LPAGTVTAPAGADVKGLAGSPVSHQVTGGDDGALADPVPVPDPAGAELAGVDAGAEAGAELDGAELTGSAVGGMALAVTVPGAVGVAVVAGAGAGTRATVTAIGSDEGTRPQVPAAAVPDCPERVAAATWACPESFTVAWSRVPDGAVATAARPDEPRPKTRRSLPAIVTDGDVLEDEPDRTSTGLL
jgi:hypothetical protein